MTKKRSNRTYRPAVSRVRTGTDDLSRIRNLHPGDMVNATFSNFDDTITAVEGPLDRLTTEYIYITDTKGKKSKFGLWQMLSLVCIERDISFLRENNINSAYENLQLLIR